MKFGITILALVVLISAGFAQPKISVDKTKIDLGVIYNGATATARVTIKNVGRDSLKILSVTTSCGCTTARKPKDYLKPGEQDAVEVEFNSTGYRGKIQKHIYIMTNDPVRNNVEVTLDGDVIEELQPINSPSVVWLGSVPIGKEVQQNLGFKNVSGKVLTITGYKSSSPSLTVDFQSKTVLPADSIFMTIRITPQKAEYINELLLFQTDSKKQSQVPVRVTLIGVTPN